MKITKYHNMPDEFLREVDDARGYSPLIEELAARLERKMVCASMSEFECPICEAILQVEHNNKGVSKVIALS